MTRHFTRLLDPLAPSVPPTPAPEATGERAPEPPASRLPEIDYGRLKFRNPATERAYQQDRQVANRYAILISFATAMVMWSLFGVLDAYLFPQTVVTLAAVRFGLVLPLFLAVTALMATPLYARAWEPLIACFTLVGGLGVTALIAVGPNPAILDYVTGYLLVLFFSAAIFRPHPYWAAATSSLITAGHLAYIAGPGALPVARVVQDAFFLVCGSLIAGLAAYAIEASARARFARDVALARELSVAQRRRDEAERANQMKSRLLANVSHELRTPLNAITGFAGILADERLGGHAQHAYRQYGEDILASAQHLLGVITQIMDLSKAQAGALELEREAVAPAELGAESTRLITEEASRQGITLVNAMPTDLPAIDGDRQRLREVLVNLLKNAVAATPEGGTVRLTAWQRPDTAGWLVIAVIDNGTGMTQAQRQAAEEPFQRLSPAQRPDAHDGAGLGLPIARELVEVHGGQLAIHTAPEAGTRVEIHLPCHAAAPPNDVVDTTS